MKPLLVLSFIDNRLKYKPALRFRHLIYPHSIHNLHFGAKIVAFFTPGEGDVL